MSRRLTVVLIAALLVASAPWPASAQQTTGRIEGRVVRKDGAGLKGVTVLINETSATTLTGPEGTFAIAGVPPGAYTLTLNLGSNVETLRDVRVAAGATTRADATVDWTAGFNDTHVVAASSRRIERVVDAPASVTTLSQAQIEAKAAPGQLPALLEFTPGVEVTQSGLYDYNLNTRGFNSSLNRRVATRIDGRDPSLPFLGAQEWSALSFGLDDLASLEFVRGPSAALYGANASSGVLDLTTRDPRSSRGGMIRVTAGQLASVNLDFRWAGSIGDHWFVKATGGIRDSGDFTVSRNGAAEYSVPCAPGQVGDCLPQEAVPLPRPDDVQIFFGSARVDRHFSNGIVATAEGGFTTGAGPVVQTGIGRVQFLESNRPWARGAVSGDQFSIVASYTSRFAPRQTALASGANLALDSSRIDVEGQVRHQFGGDRLRLVAGASVGFDEHDSFDPGQGRQTLIFESVSANRQAVFGQADWQLLPRLKLVLAARGDWGSLYDFQFSPKAAIVFTPSQQQSFRITYNEAFQAPNYAEYFLQADAAAPVNLSALNGICLASGVDCGFGLTRVLAVGSQSLSVERMQTWEVGYKGLLAERIFLTIDYHNSRASNFITDLLPQLGTAAGRINPAFGPWEGPPGLPDLAEALIRSMAPATLSNNFDGSNILAAASYTNFGRVNTQGIDFGATIQLAPGWTSSVNYSWFDFEIQDNLPGFSALLLPNTPEHSASVGVDYERNKLAVGVYARWVDAFRWGVGPFQGNVDSYTSVNLTARYDFSPRISIGVDVSNLLNDKHWESFGGDLMGARALANLRYRW